MVSICSDQSLDFEDQLNEQQNLAKPNTSIYDENVPLPSLPKELLDNPNYTDITPYSSGSILKRVIQPGTGDYYATVDSDVIVYFKLRELNCSTPILDCTGVGLRCTVGSGAYPIGFNCALESMCVGEIARVVVEPNYMKCMEDHENDVLDVGDGDRVRYEKPLVYEIFLADVDPIKLLPDGGALKFSLTPTLFTPSLFEGYRAKLAILGYCDGKLFDKRKIEILVGDAKTYDLPLVMNLCLTRMKLNEKARFIIQPLYGFRKKTKKHAHLVKKTLVYDIHVLEIPEERSVFDLNVYERIAYASAFMHNGMKFYKKNLISLARVMFERGEEMLLQDELYLAQPNDSKENIKNKELWETKRKTLHHTFSLHRFILDKDPKEFLDENGQFRSQQPADPYVEPECKTEEYKKEKEREEKEMYKRMSAALFSSGKKSTKVASTG